MRSMTIADPKLRAAVDDYADLRSSTYRVRERQISDIDKEVLGAEGRLIQRVTELLREVSERRGRVLSRDFARTLAEAKWQSIVLGTAGVLIGVFASLLVVRRTVRPLAAIATSIRAVAGGEKSASIPATDVDNEIGDIARAAEVFRQTLVDADAAREAAVRALAEQRLAEESYRKLFESSVDGIYVTTPGGALLNANPALARMMGYATPQDLISGIGDIADTVYVHPEARAEYERLMQRDGMVREYEYQVRTRNGSVLWLSDSASAVHNEAGVIVRYEGTVRDITDQKRAEDAIAEGRRLLQMVIDTVPAVINVKDKELRYVLMNRYMAGIFGVEPGDAIGRTTADLMSRYGAEKTDEPDKRVLAAGKELGFYEEEYKDASGHMRQWLVNKLPILDAAGEIENIVTVALDIGERKRVESEMRKAKDAAEGALRNLRETQNSLIEAEKLAALGRLVAGVAHEVNNPVGISLTVASALERKTSNFTAEVARGELRRSSLNDFLETSRDASSQLVANLNRAAELIQSFKQVAADRNYSDQRSFDLGDLTEQVVMSLRPGLRKHNLTLNVECQPNLMMNSYPGPYGQVLTNLFLNSVAHAFPDGKPGTVDIQVRESGKDNVEIIFSDNGIGMSLDVRRRAFDPFFTTRRDQGGTGLGLHIVYSIVTTRLGGRLDLDSQPGGGTRIQMILPRTAPTRTGGGIGNPLIDIRQLVQGGAEDLARFADERGSVHAAAGIRESSGYADADRIGPAEQRIVIVTRGGVALYQDLALEGIALHGVAAGIKQIGVTAENLAVPEQNDAAALAGAPIQQGDVDRIEPVVHDVPDAGRRAHGSRSRSYAKAWHAPSTRQVARQFPHRKQTQSVPLRRDAGMMEMEPNQLGPRNA